MNKKKVLTRDDILGFGLRVEELEIPEWGDSVVLVREMSALQVERDGQYIIKANGKPDYGKAVHLPTKQCARQVVGEDRKRLFTDKEIDKLSDTSAAFISRVAEKVRELSGQGRNREDEAIFGWLEENHPDILKRYQEETGAVAKAKENFT